MRRPSGAWPGDAITVTTLQAVVSLTKYLSKHEEIRGLIVQLARHGSEAAVRTLTTPPGGRETWELTTQLAREGVGQAVVTLAARWGERDATWKLIEQLEDADFDRMANQLQGPHNPRTDPEPTQSQGDLDADSAPGPTR